MGHEGARLVQEGHGEDHQVDTPEAPASVACSRSDGVHQIDSFRSSDTFFTAMFAFQARIVAYSSGVCQHPPSDLITRLTPGSISTPSGDLERVHARREQAWLAA